MRMPSRTNQSLNAGKRSRLIALLLTGGTLLVLALPAASSASFVSYSANPNAIFGSPVEVPALSWSGGVAEAPWADPTCPPVQGTQDTDPGVPPGSWSQVLAELAPTHANVLQTEAIVKEAVDQGWAAYLEATKGKEHPPGFATLADAEQSIVGKVRSLLLSQETWDRLIQYFGNVAKPTPADAEEFLAHIDEYTSGVSSAACDGNDGFRLFTSTDSASLWQLEPDGTWAKVTFDAGDQPPENAQWLAVPGAVRSYIAMVPAGNPQGILGIPLRRVAGEITIGTGALTGSCLADDSTTEGVSNQLAGDVYTTVQSAASWVPQLPALPSFSASCASIPAVYTPWSAGPAIAAPAISDHASYIAAYTATATEAGVERWHRSGTAWGTGERFAVATFNQGGDEVEPRLAISGDGSTVAGCWLGGSTSGSSFQPLRAPGQYSPRFPEVFHFAAQQVDYPTTGPQDSRACSHVSLDGTGETVWWTQNETPKGWFSSATVLPDWASLSIPESHELQATGPAGAPDAFTATATDAEGTVPVSCNPAPGSTFGFGKTPVSCSASTAAGTVSGSFNVTVSDTTPPVISVPSGITVEASGPTGANVNYAASASDAVDGSITPGCSKKSGSVFALGTTKVECVASDSHGNTARASFNVVVRDTTPPTITGVPQNITTDASSVAGATVTYPTPTASDAVDIEDAVACEPASGSLFALGVTQVVCTARDSHGNEAQATFTVTVTRVPTVTKLSVKRGPASGGSEITITGSKLEGISEVRFGTVATTAFQVESDTLLVVSSPASVAGTVEVTVAGPGGSSAASKKTRFKYAPEISAVTPDEGSVLGGNEVTVTGYGFSTALGATKLKFGTAMARTVHCMSSSECSVLSPHHVPGTVDVTAIVNKSKGVAGLQDRFTYR